ncbi:MAG: response regulator [Gammaproteobacteria bacterium]|nr:response regulator [Gammaproteobacteria bacterium]
MDKSDLEFRRLLEKLPAAAYICDANGLITYFNQRAIDLWGRAPKLNDSADRFCGSFKLFSVDGTPIPHDRCWMALALHDGKEYNGQEIIIERSDGSRWVALAHANPFFDDTGKVCGAVNVLVDISERKRAEDMLRQADRNKNDFLAMLAHELRNPLAPIRNGLEIMQLAGNDAGMAAEARKMMERQIGNMVRLIDDLLDLSRVTQGKLELRKEKIDLRTVMQDALETSRPLIEELGHQLRVNMPGSALYVSADRSRLAQVFANLLNNSAKYTRTGGHIWLTVERQGTDAIVKVKDDGVGISPELLPRIFNLFTQADRSLEHSQNGLGIGLSIVRGLVEMHGGIVEASSAGPGEGSEFSVRLSTVMSPALETASKQNEANDRAASKHRILVVDDNKDAAISLAMMLKIMDHETRTAHDGVEALETAENFLPNVVILDIGLPKLNGYDVCRQIRQQAWGKDMVMIAVTGWSQEEDKRQSKEAGFNFHMLKPVDPQALVKLLAGLLLTPA